MAVLSTELEYELTDHLGNVRATFTSGSVPHSLTLASSADYYPYGTKIPGNWTGAGGAYRYGYQGQFAEDATDETGYVNFEARMYDGDKGRWFVPDPANQYWSGYVGMGNNPVSYVDSDGRFAEKQRAQFSAWWHGGEYHQNSNNEHYAVWGDGMNVEYSNFGKQKPISVEYGAKIDFNLGANLVVGGKDVNLSVFSFNLIESKNRIKFDAKRTYETESNLIGFGDEKTRVTGLQANVAGYGYESASFGLNSNLEAINISNGGPQMTASGKLHGLPVESTLSNGSMDFSTGGGAILTGKIFLKINY